MVINPPVKVVLTLDWEEPKEATIVGLEDRAEPDINRCRICNTPKMIQYFTLREETGGVIHNFCCDDCKDTLIW